MMTEGGFRVRWYEVVYVGLVVAFVALSVYFVGRPKVGLIDIRQVSEELGVTKQMTADYQNWRTEALARIKAVNQSTDEKMTAVNAKLKKARRKDDKEELNAELARLERGRRRSIERVNRELAGRWREASVAFRKQLDPIIAKIARKKRLDVVLEMGKAGVAYINRRVVITDDVIAEARAVSPGGGFIDASTLGEEETPETEANDG